MQSFLYYNSFFDNPSLFSTTIWLVTSCYFLKLSYVPQINFYKYKRIYIFKVNIITCCVLHIFSQIEHFFIRISNIRQVLNPDNLGVTIQILTWQKKKKVKKGLNNGTRLISEIFFFYLVVKVDFQELLFYVGKKDLKKQKKFHNHHIKPEVQSKMKQL